MLFVILAYHEEGDVKEMTPQEDAALMTDLYAAHERINAKSRLGPAARLDYTNGAATLRGLAPGKLFDGPFAETKEALLGLYFVEAASMEEAVEAARELKKVNAGAVYEIRPIMTYSPDQTPE